MTDLIILILWIAAGCGVLFFKDKITKLDYGIVWFVLIMQLIDNLKN